eukprot:7894246-Karenia_brevis.AAC.1
MTAHRLQNNESKKRTYSTGKARKRLADFRRDIQRDGKSHKWAADPMFEQAFLEMTAYSEHA